MKILHKLFRRYEVRKTNATGNDHVSWHMTYNAAHWKMVWWQGELYWNDGERWSDGATYYVRKVEEV